MIISLRDLWFDWIIKKKNLPFKDNVYRKTYIAV